MARGRFLSFLAIVMSVAFAGPAQAGDDWLPITPQELAMKESPINPGAHAVLLYREVDTDDVLSEERHYYRLKILSETGKKYGNVEVVYSKQGNRVYDIKARTVRPDGSEVKFTGEVFDKMLVKARGVKVHVKTFGLPEVQVGSILEYRYKVSWPKTRLNSPEWIVQDDLPTLRLNLAFKPWPQRSVSWTSRLPPGPVPQEVKRGRIELVMQNVPGFQEEEYMPPESEVKYRVDFFYFYSFEPLPKTPDDYWTFWGKIWYEAIEQFIGKHKGIQQAAAQLVAPNDPPETKLLKIYARVQQVRNLSYERDKTEKEEKREKRKENSHVEDVWKNGYGNRDEINRLFVALARAAGFEAYAARVAQRRDQFFQKNVLNWTQLDTEVAVVKVGDKERFFDPGTPSCPFEMLAWLRSGVSGIRPTKDGGTFLSTPPPTSDQAVIERKGTLHIDEKGTLKGKVQVTFNGLEALTHRLSASENDDAGRRKDLEDEIKGWLPSGATVKLGEITGWEGFDQPLQTEIEIEVLGFAVAAGRRSLLPLGVFQSNDAQLFRHVNRIHPVYLRNPYREMDDLTFEIPSSLRVESLPQPRHNAQAYGNYQIVRSNRAGGVRLQRVLSVDGYFFPLEYYGSLRSFFSEVKAGDEEQVVLQSASAAPRNNQDR